MKNFLLASRYKIREKLGDGSTGSVYAAFDYKYNMMTAIKLLKSTAPENVIFFKKEFRILSYISHPGIVKYFELHYTGPGQPVFFTMDLISGKPLSEAVRNQTGKPDYEKLRDIIRQLGSGLGYLHDMGIVHRDIKPGNIIIKQDGRAVLLDFSLSARVTGFIPEWENLNEVTGTFAYMAPEVFTGSIATPATDWYSFGAVIYECLTGRLPGVFSGIDPVPPVKLVDATPPDLNRLALALLHRNAEKRPAFDGINEILINKDKTCYYETSHLRQSVHNDYYPFVGRKKELIFFEKLLSECFQHKNRLAIIQGDAGIGKTTLAEHFFYRLTGKQGIIIFRSRCNYCETIRFNAIDGIVDDLTRFLDSVPHVVHKVAPRNLAALLTLFPVLTCIYKRRPDNYVQYDEYSNESAGCNAFIELLYNLAKEYSIILFIDDMQWSDFESIRLIINITKFSNKNRILTLLSARLDQVHGYSSLGDLIRAKSNIKPEKTILNLKPLCREASQTLSGHIGKLHDSYREQIVNEAGGIPFLIIALTKFTFNQENIIRSERSYIKISLSNFIRHELSHVSDIARTIIEVAAVSDIPLNYESLYRVTGIHKINRAIITNLFDKSLLRYVNFNNNPAIRPYNQLVQKKIYESIAPFKRQSYRFLLSNMAKH